MPHLLESPDAGRRDRELTAAITSKPAPEPEAQARDGVVALAGASGSETVRAPILFFDHVSKWYGPVIGINQVTLELRPGITGLVGHNGSGKSTLLRLA